MSTIFLLPWVRKMLNWTQHEQAIEYKSAGIMQTALAFAIMAVDFAIARIAKFSLFTDFDTRGLKTKARISPLVRLGYFQNASVRRSLEPLGRQIAPVPQQGLVAMHVRGGDLLQLEREGRNEYGMLNADYYDGSLAHIRDALDREGRSVGELLVLTDDPEYAATQEFDVDGVPDPDIQRLPLKETLSRAVGAEWFVSSNSTMSYWIVQLREGRRSIAPQPFQKRRDYDLHHATQRLAFDYQ